MEEAQIFSWTFIYYVALYKPRYFARGMVYLFVFFLY